MIFASLLIASALQAKGPICSLYVAADRRCLGRRMEIVARFIRGGVKLNSIRAPRFSVASGDGRVAFTLGCTRLIGFHRQL
jgi:hypothetical protein